MSVIDKFLDIMRLNDDDYEFDNDDYDFDEDDYQEEVKEKRPSRKERKAEQQHTENRGSKVWKYVLLNQIQLTMREKLQIHC